MQRGLELCEDSIQLRTTPSFGSKACTLCHKPYTACSTGGDGSGNGDEDHWVNIYEAPSSLLRTLYALTQKKTCSNLQSLLSLPCQRGDFEAQVAKGRPRSYNKEAAEMGSKRGLSEPRSKLPNHPGTCPSPSCPILRGREVRDWRQACAKQLGRCGSHPRSSAQLRPPSLHAEKQRGQGAGFSPQGKTDGVYFMMKSWVIVRSHYTPAPAADRAAPEAGSPSSQAGL